jgi:hypothetical protein
MSPTIPNTGRLGSLANTIAEVVGNDVLNELFGDYKASLKGESLSNWVLQILKKLEKAVGNEKTIMIMEEDGRKSCGNGFKNTVNKLMEKSDSIQEFIENLQEHYKKSSFFEYIDDQTIVVGHYKCYLMIKSAKKPIDSNIFCHFCVGHGKEFYETGVKKPVNAKILETVMTGGQTCKFKFKF